MNTITDREYAELKRMMDETRKMQREAFKIDAETEQSHFAAHLSHS